MKKALSIAILTSCVAFLSGGTAAGQSDNANSAAPGQDRVCLVTTGTPGRFNDVDIVDTKWLPRKAAEAQAAKAPKTMTVKDYSGNPLVGTKYDTAEELCKTHFI